jgi:hypothetical protein
MELAETKKRGSTRQHAEIMKHRYIRNRARDAIHHLSIKLMIRRALVTEQQNNKCAHRAYHEFKTNETALIQHFLRLSRLQRLIPCSSC